jgi:hypothetical protein
MGFVTKAVKYIYHILNDISFYLSSVGASQDMYFHLHC